MINAGGFAFSATRDGAIVSEERGVFLFVLRLDRLPTLQLDNREIIGAQLVPIDDLHKTGRFKHMSVASFHRLTAAQPNLSHDPHRDHAHSRRSPPRCRSTV
jgi:hypothetical protein